MADTPGAATGLTVAEQKALLAELNCVRREVRLRRCTPPAPFTGLTQSAPLVHGGQNGRLSVLTNDLEIIGQLNPNGIFRTDGSGRVTFANSEWFRITGLTALGPDCDHWLDRVDSNDAAEVRADWEAALRDPGVNFSREFRFRRTNDETPIVVWINSKSLAEDAPEEDGLAVHVRAVVGAFTDVTHWRELEQQQIASLTAVADVQQRRAADAEAHRLEQERFVDVVCHEIRNPLNGIVNNVDQIRDRRHTLRPKLVTALAVDPGNELLRCMLDGMDEEDGMLGAIDLCAYHQRRITDDILQISRLRLGRYILEESDFWVDELVRGAINMFQTEANISHIPLEYTPQSPRAYVHGDMHRISQILVNLLSNAIKFTRLVTKRQVTVAATVGAASLPGIERTLVLKIVDTGIGISPTEQAKLFAPFAQASAKTFTTYGGSGMGLFITKELVELMGGSIRMESEPDHGTTFTIEIPIQSVPQPADEPVGTNKSSLHLHRANVALADTTPAPPRTAVKRQLQPFTILVAEDNDINRVVMVRYLQAVPNNAVIAVNDGVEAVAAATSADRTDAIDLILMDVEMPNMDGLEATRRIRAHEAALGKPAVPIVGVSGNARQEHIDAALAAGMTEYIIKPFNRASLMNAVERLLGISLDTVPPSRPES